MRLSVLVFAGLRSALGRDHVDLEVPDGATAGDLVRALAEAHPALRGPLQAARVAVDQAFVGDDAPLREGVEVAIIPPVSGGHDGEPTDPPADPVEAPRALLSRAPLDPSSAIAAVAHAGAGGITTFIGNVRDRSLGRSIARLEYSAYEPMALKVMTSIAAAIEAEIEGARVAIHHRLGVLDVGESAVVIAASAAHRAEAFDACRRAIEALKREVPIWKREVATDGESWFGRGP
ncbi:MAG: molybdenum cofactor biosynthesis protein MoaE [Nannocystaceae bacterium]